MGNVVFLFLSLYSSSSHSLCLLCFVPSNKIFALPLTNYTRYFQKLFCICMVEENKILVKPKDYLDMHTNYLTTIQTNTNRSSMKLIIFNRIDRNSFKSRMFIHVSIKIYYNAVAIIYFIYLFYWTLKRSWYHFLATRKTFLKAKRKALNKNACTTFTILFWVSFECNKKL